MSKAEYRYYELSQEIPLLVLTGGSSKKNSRKRAIINMRFYPLPLIFFFFDRLNQVEHEPELSHSNTMNYVRKIVNYMELHYMEEIKARDYARSCGLSETHMRRIFSEYTNMSPSEYLNVVRINKACELLAHGNDSIEDISRAAGYPVLSTFLRNFRKITGLSPSAWRKQGI